MCQPLNNGFCLKIRGKSSEIVKAFLNGLKIDFSCFLGCKCAKNIQNADLPSNWIVIQ
jgi:hypothetical protein